jgi:Bacterial TSP3 repeat
MRLRIASALLFASLATVSLSCGSSGGHGSGPDAGQITADDADGDTISDTDEGRADNIDTDGDGIPDYLDTDSDNDGIPDYREAGDGDLGTKPIDSDSDGIPDFRDTDSDNNGIADGDDGVDDLDSDGKPNFQDLDDDGDLIPDVLEIGSDPAHPIDTDGDGTPDYHDTDSDNDTIPDLIETNSDYDGDGVGNWRDLDSDDDCRPDEVEANGMPQRDTDGDGHYDWVDRDSDDDGLLDSQEDTNCNGIVDNGETDPLNEDTDGDGVSDLVESAAGTDPLDPTDNPQANGDFVFVEPYQKPQNPTDDDLDFTTHLQKVDLYVILDRSGSMTSAISNVKANLTTVVSDLKNTIPDLWAGAATMGYAGSTGGEAFHHAYDIQPTPNFSGLPINEPNGCCAEDETFSLYATISGNGTGSVSSCGIQTVAARSSCAGSPAANAGYSTFGYPCFRDGALPVVILATDEGPLSGSDTNHCPDWTSVVKQLYLDQKARIVGVDANPNTTTDNDLKALATATGAVDSTNGNAPLVFPGQGANAAQAIENGIITLANGIPLDMNAVATDDTSDSVDAIAAFIDHLETLQLGTAQCSDGLTDIDTNSDGFKDKYLQVTTGTPVCWKVVSKQNTTVPATDQPQLFQAFVTVYGDGITALSTRNVYFLVPPEPADVPVN